MNERLLSGAGIVPVHSAAYLLDCKLPLIEERLALLQVPRLS